MALFKKDRGDSAGQGSDPQAGGRTDASGAHAEAAPTKGEGNTMAGQAIGAERTPMSGAGTENAMLGRGTRVSGKITFEGKARIDGQVEGEIVAADNLEIGESALVNAQINGTVIIVQGKVTGDLTASKKLEIRAPGRLYGNVTTPSLVIEEGVIFEGHCSMGAKEGQAGDRVTLLAKEEGSGTAAPAARAAAASNSK
ncbi:MAG: polymer-forming cytoskeletal protein [Candidatus Binatia bacterium]|nr:polymer-forming cytoskeletal protein [Candidatus Binatia bacterium]